MCIFVLCGHLSHATTTNSSQPVVVYQGKDVLVTADEIGEVRDYIEANTSYKAKSDQYADYVLELELFAKEGFHLGLTEGDGNGEALRKIDSQEKVATLIQVHKVYLEHLLDTLSINKDIIASFYYAFPEKFVLPQLEKDGKEEVCPLDQSTHKKIRQYLSKIKSSSIRNQKVKELKEKYQITKGS
jgi:hypothetical protein